MQIKWYGHACFEITTNNGQVVLHDPYQDMLGYVLPPNIKADVVLSSHDHGDHNYIETLQPGFELINQTGLNATEITEFKGTASFHDQSEGAERGLNTIYSYLIDGLKVCHLGDLGHLLSPEQVAELSKTDILLIPVGGTYTLDPHMAVEVIKQLKPRLIIPMHYRTADMGEAAAVFSSVTEFTDLLGYKTAELNSNILDLTVMPIESLPPVLIMDYK